MRLLSAALLVALAARSLAGQGSAPPAAAVPTQSPTLVVLVRHAEKDSVPAADPPLTAAGRARAEALARALGDLRVDAIIVTPTTRTRTTAAPLAAAAHLAPIEMAPTGGVAAHAAAVAARIRAEWAGRHVVVVGHSNTLAAIVRALGGPALPDLCDGQYSAMYVLEVPASGAASLVRASYGAADPPDACAAPAPRR